MNNFEKGFIKKAGEAGLLPIHAEEILKAAGFLDTAWNAANAVTPVGGMMQAGKAMFGGALDLMGNTGTNIKDYANLGINNLKNNKLIHGAKAGLGWFTGAPGSTFESRFNDSMSDANADIGRTYGDMAVHSAQQGDMGSALGRANQAAQYGDWTNNMDGLNDIGERLGNFKGINQEAEHASTLANDRMRQLRAQFETVKPGYTPPPPPTYSGNTTQHDWGIQPKLKTGPVQTPRLLQAPGGQRPEAPTFSQGGPPRSSLELLRKPYGS